MSTNNSDNVIEGELVDSEEKYISPAQTHHGLDNVSITGAIVAKYRLERVSAAINAHTDVIEAMTRGNESVAELAESDLLKQNALERLKNAHIIVKDQSEFERKERLAEQQKADVELSDLEIEQRERNIRKMQLEQEEIMEQRKLDALKEGKGVEPGIHKESVAIIAAATKEFWHNHFRIMQELKDRGDWSGAIEQASEAEVHKQIQKLTEELAAGVYED